MHKILCITTILHCCISTCFASSPCGNNNYTFYDPASSDSDSAIYRSSSPLPKEITPEERMMRQKTVFLSMLKNLGTDYERFLSEPSEPNFLFLEGQLTTVKEMFSQPENAHLHAYEITVSQYLELLPKFLAELTQKPPKEEATVSLVELVEKWKVTMDPQGMIQRLYEDFKDDTTDLKLNCLCCYFFILEKRLPLNTDPGLTQLIKEWRPRMERKGMILRPGAFVSPRGNAPVKSARNTPATQRIQSGKK